MKTKQLEQDLYEPVRRFFCQAGYTVRGEVADCDVVAQKGSLLIAIELKLSLNLTVIVQATQRQKLCTEVWIAIPRPSRSLRTRPWQKLLHLLRRLELGLLLVDLNLPDGKVEAVLLPQFIDRRQVLQRNKQRYNQLQKEFLGRHGDQNKGGIARTRRMTVYREQALLIAALLRLCGPAGAAHLRRLGAPDKTWNILYDNYDRWFEKLGKGQYGLTNAGLDALQRHEVLAAELLMTAQGGLPAVNSKDTTP